MDRLTIKNNPAEAPSPFWGTVILPLLKYKKAIYIFVSVSVLATLVIALLLKNKYTSTATILPSGPSSLTSGLKDLAAGSLSELGLGSAPSLENTSALYPNILVSRMISERILKRKISFQHDSTTLSMTLEEYIDAPNFDRAIKGLKKLVRIATDKKTGVISIAVTTKYPEFSTAIVHSYLEELDNYNINYRQSTARENMKFTANRLAEIRGELTLTEDTLRSFKGSNMNYMVSIDPQLQLELTRLQRESDIKSALYLTMSQQHEMARVDAVKDIPVVQVLDRGSVPVEKSSPRRSLLLIGALFGSLFVSIIVTLWIDLAVRRDIRSNLDSVMSSPSVRINKIEAVIARRLSGLVNVIQKKETLD